MVSKLITFALGYSMLVLLLAVGLFGWAIYSMHCNPIDAIPDLSENQVIVFTEWMGRSPGNRRPGHLSACQQPTEHP